MKAGDLVRMKPEMWWRLQSRKDFSPKLGVIYSVAGKGIKVYMPDNQIKLGLADHYEIVQTSKK